LQRAAVSRSIGSASVGDARPAASPAARAPLTWLKARRRAAGTVRAMLEPSIGGLRSGDTRDAHSGFAHIVYVQNWENARHLRNVRVLGANSFALIVAACFAALQLARAQPLVEITLLGFLVVVASIQLLISIELKRELDDCMARIAGQVERTGWRDDVALLPRGESPRWLRLRWLYPAFYAASAIALGVAFANRVWA
jgi:hypothetical protein